MSHVLLFCIVVIVMLRERTGAKLMSKLGIALAMLEIGVVIGLFSFFQCCMGKHFMFRNLAPELVLKAKVKG